MIFVLFFATLIKSLPLLCENSTAYTRPSYNKQQTDGQSLHQMCNFSLSITQAIQMGRGDKNQQFSVYVLLNRFLQFEITIIVLG